MDENLTKTSEDSGKWYTGITGNRSPWQDGATPPLNAENLNKIEDALIDFLGSDGVVNNIETHLNSVDDKLTNTVKFVGYDMNSDDSEYPTSLAGKISTLEEDVDENESNITSVIQKTFGTSDTLNSSSTENNIIKRVGASETNIGELDTAVNQLFDGKHDAGGTRNVYLKSETYSQTEADETFATKVDVENEFNITNSNVETVNTEVTNIKNTLGSSEGTGTVLNRIDALETGVYQKSEVDETFAKKTEVYSKTDVYSKEEINTNIESIATPIVESKIDELVPTAVNNEVSKALEGLLILRCGSATENIEE